MIWIHRYFHSPSLSAQCVALTVTVTRICRCMWSSCDGPFHSSELHRLWLHVFLWPFWELFNDMELIPCCVWISLNKWMLCSALTFNLCSHLLWSIGCQICWYNWFLCHMQAGYVTSWSFLIDDLLKRSHFVPLSSAIILHNSLYFSFIIGNSYWRGRSEKSSERVGDQSLRLVLHLSYLLTWHQYSICYYMIQLRNAPYANTGEFKIMFC